MQSSVQLSRPHFPQPLSAMAFKHLLLLLAFVQDVLCQNQPPGVINPLAKKCGPTTANIVCIEKYASVMPYHFYRAPSYGSTDVSFGQTHVSNSSSFHLVKNADFLIFDDRGYDVLGSSPTYDLMFKVSDAVHEAPVYVQSLNRLYVSRLAPPPVC